MIIASDGIWDALTSDMAAKSCRGLPAELAAKLVVKVTSSVVVYIIHREWQCLFWLNMNICVCSSQEALRSRGLKDDTTCLVVDIIPSDHPVPAPTPRKKQNVLSSLIFGKKAHDSMKTSNKLAAVGVVEELFEEGSAMLAERFVHHNIPFLSSLFISLELLAFQFCIATRMHRNVPTSYIFGKFYSFY